MSKFEDSKNNLRREESLEILRSVLYFYTVSHGRFPSNKEAIEMASEIRGKTLTTGWLTGLVGSRAIDGIEDAAADFGIHTAVLVEGAVYSSGVSESATVEIHPVDRDISTVSVKAVDEPAFQAPMPVSVVEKIIVQKPTKSELDEHAKARLCSLTFADVPTSTLLKAMSNIVRELKTREE